MNACDKPLLNSRQQVEHMLAKGIKFEIINEQDAEEYLRTNNNYFKLRAYRKNFDKYVGGKNDGKYICLDFAMLRDLSIIDMRLRYVLIHMALDTEHFLKVKLLRRIEENGEDGYQIVADYFAKLKSDDEKNKTSRYNQLENELSRNEDNPYCGGIIRSYHGNYAAWAFIEVIPLGSLLHFYRFCADRFSDKNMISDFMLLKDIRELRNACAHSNCLLFDLKAEDRQHDVNYKMSAALGSIPKSTRKKRFSNERMRQICTMIYAHSVLVPSPGIHRNTAIALHDVTARMKKHSDYYAKTPIITACFGFFEKVVNVFFQE